MPIKRENSEHRIAPNPINEWQKQFYNKSLFSSIRYSTEKSIAEQPLYTQAATLELPVHFRYETYQETRFLFDAHQQTMLNSLADAGYRVPRPRYVYVKALDVSELHTAVLRKNAAMDRKSSVFPPVCESLLSKGFWGKLISDALYVLFNAAYECTYISNARRCFSAEKLIAKYHINSKITQLFSLAATIATDVESLMEEALRVLSSVFSKKHSETQNAKQTETEAQFAFNKAKDLASKCREFIVFISEKQKMLDSVFLKTNARSADDTSSDRNRFERKIDVVAANKNAEIQSCVIGFLERYQKISGGTYFMLFSAGLSSGEKNLLRMLTQFRHVLADDFIGNTRKMSARKGLINCFAYKNSENVEYACDTLFLFLDEADLTYHPEWQRQFVSLLTAVLPGMFSEYYENGKKAGCKDIQVIVATHSPLLLSDIPVQSCIFLKNEDKLEETTEEQREEYGLIAVDNHSVIRQTFASNLHDLLNNAFFLNRTIGEFARRKIIIIAKELKELSQNPQNSEKREECRSYIQTIELIGDPIVRNKLRNLYSNCFPPQKDIDYTLESVSLLAEHPETLSDEERKRIIQKLEQTASMLRDEIEGDVS